MRLRTGIPIHLSVWNKCVILSKVARERGSLMHSGSFFAYWTADMAYVLGYWFADGNMYTQASAGSYVVSISSKDESHLSKLRSVIGVGRVSQMTGSDVFKLVICRKEVYDDLLRLGGTERKSLTLTWKEPPAEYLAHFVRGYVDGDGSLGWNESRLSTQPMIEIAGTSAFLRGLAEAVFTHTGIPAPRIHVAQRVHVVRWYGVAAKCLAIWLYDRHPGLMLDRKAQRASEFRSWTPRVLRRRRITPRMRQVFGGCLP